MSAAPRMVLTEEDYLRIERAALEKSEFYKGEMFAMAGTSRFHCAININLTSAIQGQLTETKCEQFANEMRVKNEATGLYSYPDCLIVCGEPQFMDSHFDVLLNPRVIFEILSKPTESYDRGFKFESYRRLSSVMEYVLISQTKPMVERYARQPDETWILTTFEGLDAVFSLTSVAVRVPLRELYRNVTFESVEGPAA